MPKKIIEKECNKHGLTEFILEGRGYYRCKKCRSAAVVKKRTNAKKKLIDLFGGACQWCGYDTCLRCLHFHHVDPAQKSFAISANGRTHAWEKLLAEAKKCILVCSNCHGEIESGIRVIDSCIFRI